MPATTEALDQFPADVKKLGILAGGGTLPLRLIEACNSLGIGVFTVAFKGQTSPETVKDTAHIWTSLGSAGKTINALKAQGIHDLVLIGNIRRPSFNEIAPDWKGAQILTRIGLKARGDNGLLVLLRAELEREGFRLHGIHKFMKHLLTPAGSLGLYKPNKEQMSSITRGIKIAKALGEQDVGQSVIMQNDLVIALEAIEGTDALITRSHSLLRPGGGAILVKACKPQQDRDLDLPTIGPETIRIANAAGLCGIAIEAHNSLMVDAQELINCADKHKMFVFGFSSQ
jgi:UDP-2,3-diacylglucosamine hydrolase